MNIDWYGTVYWSYKGLIKVLSDPIRLDIYTNVS